MCKRENHKSVLIECMTSRKKKKTNYKNRDSLFSSIGTEAGTCKQ